jgi:pimeloyl-ACP methyl ester carboxylesterase
MGAVTTLRCAALNPTVCRAVIASDGQWRSLDNARILWDERIVLAKEKGMAALAKATVTRWFQPHFFEHRPAIATKVEAMAAETKFNGFVKTVNALQEYEFRDDYPNISVPVLFLAGEEDGLVPKVVEQMAKVTPGCQFHIIPQTHYAC